MMAGRVPMVGDPKPLDRLKMAAELKRATLKSRKDCLDLLAEAEAENDENEIAEIKKILKQTQKLIDDYGFEEL